MPGNFSACIASSSGPHNAKEQHWNLNRWPWPLQSPSSADCNVDRTHAFLDRRSFAGRLFAGESNLLASSIPQELLTLMGIIVGSTTVIKQKKCAPVWFWSIFRLTRYTCASIQLIGENMKRPLVVRILALGLAAVAGSMFVNREGMNSDGNPPPPPDLSFAKTLRVLSITL